MNNNNNHKKKKRQQRNKTGCQAKTNQNLRQICEEVASSTNLSAPKITQPWKTGCGCIYTDAGDLLVMPRLTERRRNGLARSTFAVPHPERRNLKAALRLKPRSRGDSGPAGSLFTQHPAIKAAAQEAPQGWNDCQSVSQSVRR